MNFAPLTKEEMFEQLQEKKAELQEKIKPFEAELKAAEEKYKTQTEAFEKEWSETYNNFLDQVIIYKNGSPIKIKDQIKYQGKIFVVSNRGIPSVIGKGMILQPFLQMTRCDHFKRPIPQAIWQVTEENFKNLVYLGSEVN